jgi:hypothetical protein
MRVTLPAWKARTVIDDALFRKDVTDPKEKDLLKRSLTLFDALQSIMMLPVMPKVLRAFHSEILAFSFIHQELRTALGWIYAHGCFQI